jgi:hypothetical protein
VAVASHHALPGERGAVGNDQERRRRRHAPPRQGAGCGFGLRLWPDGPHPREGRPHVRAAPLQPSAARPCRLQRASACGCCCRRAPRPPPPRPPRRRPLRLPPPARRQRCTA